MRLVLPTLTLAASTIALTGCGLFHESPPQQAHITLNVASAAMAAGAPDMALRVAEIVLKKQPGNVAAMVAKGDALYAMGAPDDARAAYRQAIAVDPADPGAEIGLGRTLVRSDPHAAEMAFLAALVRQPDDILALNDLGIARDMQGHHEEAQQAYRQALKVSPDSTDVQTNLGLSLALSGDRTTAMRMLQPVAAAPEATAMQRADLAVAMLPAGSAEPAAPVRAPIPAQVVANDAAPLAISLAPVAAVHQQALPSEPIVHAVIASKAAPAAHIDPASVVADASAIVPAEPRRVEPVVARDDAPPAPIHPAPATAARDGVTPPPAAVPAPVPKAVQADVSAIAPVEPAPKPTLAVHNEEPAINSATVAAALSQPPSPLPPAAAPRITLASLEPDAKPVSRRPEAQRQSRTSAAEYYVQIGALDSARAAHAEWRKIQARSPGLLGNHKPALQLARQHDRTFWRLRTGAFVSLSDANDFCAKLRAAGSRCWSVGVARLRRSTPS